MGSIIKYKGKAPQVGQRVFIAEGACLVGDVSIGDDSSVFYNAVLRADLAEIKIGKRTNIQDNCIVGAGALVTAGKNFPENSLIVGSPAHIARTLTADEIKNVKIGVEHYLDAKDELLKDV